MSLIKNINKNINYEQILLINLSFIKQNKVI